MKECDISFRGAVFGGFRRQDVREYIETITQERNEEQERWAAQQEEAQASQRQAEERLAQLEAERDEAMAKVSTLEEKVDRLRTIIEEKSEALVQAEVRASTLETQVKALEPQAQSWQRIRDTAGEIEVSAHERAQSTIQEARARAEEVRSEGTHWLLEIQNRCDTLQRDLQTSRIAAERELDVIRESFSRAGQDMNGFREALSELLRETEQEAEACSMID